MTVYDCIWLYMTVYDCIWLYMTVYESIWHQMTLWEYVYDYMCSVPGSQGVERLGIWLNQPEKLYLSTKHKDSDKSSFLLQAPLRLLLFLPMLLPQIWFGSCSFTCPFSCSLASSLLVLVPAHLNVLSPAPNLFLVFPVPSHVHVLALACAPA